MNADSPQLSTAAGSSADASSSGSDRSTKGPVRRWLGRARKLLIGLFVCWHLLAMTVDNIRSLEIAKDQPVGDAINTVARPFRYYNSAIFSEQDWVMFSPNVGSISSVPVLRLTFIDGTKEILRCEAEPKLLNADPSDPASLDPDAPEELRRYAWTYRFGGNRMRKVCENAQSKRSKGRGWIRYRMGKYLAEHPDARERIWKIEYLVIDISHQDSTGYAHFSDVDEEDAWTYELDKDPHWQWGDLPNYQNWFARFGAIGSSTSSASNAAAGGEG